MNSIEEYKRNIDSLNKSFHLILEEIGNTYPLFKLYPDVKEYRENYERDVSNLENIKSEIFLLMTNLQNDVNNLTKTSSDLNRKIDKLNKDNDSLKRKLSNFRNQDNAAYGELQTRIKNFYFGLAENIILLLIAGSGILFFTNKNN